MVLPLLGGHLKESVTETGGFVFFWRSKVAPIFAIMLLCRLKWINSIYTEASNKQNRSISLTIKGDLFSLKKVVNSEGCLHGVKLQVGSANQPTAFTGQLKCEKITEIVHFNIIIEIKLITWNHLLFLFDKRLNIHKLLCEILIHMGLR